MKSPLDKQYGSDGPRRNPVIEGKSVCEHIIRNMVFI